MALYYLYSGVLTKTYIYIPHETTDMATGPRVLGHEPLVLEEQRSKVVETIDGLGVVGIRTTDNPALPFLPDL